MPIYLVGVDPGLAHFGYAVCELHPNGSLSICKDDKNRYIMDCIVTEKSSKKRHVLASDDNLRRAREVARHFLGILLHWKPKLLCAEAMSFPRSSSASQKLGVSWGIIATLSEFLNLPIVQASPQEIKQKVCWRKDASKEDIQNALAKKYNLNIPDFGAKDFREHLFDALAVIEACLDSEVARFVRNIS